MIDNSGQWYYTGPDAIDAVNDIVYVLTNTLSNAFILAVDTQTPVCTFTDTSSTLPPGTPISVGYHVTDNIANVKVTFWYAKGGGVPVAAQPVYVNGGAVVFDTATIPATNVTSDNGVSAYVTIDDGHYATTINISRRVIRSASDPLATQPMQWVPFRFNGDT